MELKIIIEKGPCKNMAKYHVVEKNEVKGEGKKGGNTYFFPNWSKVCIFFPY